MQQTFAASTAFAAAGVGVDIFIEHFKGSYGDKWMWTPVVLTPPLVAAGIAGVVSERAARTALPAVGALFAANGLAGMFFHLRGVLRKPGSLHQPLYNIVMGPPFLAPGSLTMIGALGMLARVSRRERWS